MPREEIVVPLDDVTVSMVSPKHRRLEERILDDDPNPSERRTGSDYPINNLHLTVDDDDKNIQRRSYDGLNSMKLKNRH